MTTGTERTPRLEVRHLSKTFSGVVVLEDAYLSVLPGEVHALVGQNGSGKSTLIKLVSGVYTPDPGAEILVDGDRIGPPMNPKMLHEQGVSFVHQDLGLVPDLTVRENVRVGRHAINRVTRRINKKADTRAVLETFKFLNLDIDPNEQVANLLPSERVGVAVARALQDRTPGSGVIVFDESSRSIPRESLSTFYEMIRLLSSQGTAVLIVSHDLKEVLRIADRTTVLRNGRVVDMGAPTDELDESMLTNMLLGRAASLGNIMEEVPSVPTSQAVELHDIRGGRIAGLSASIRFGEVVGITGTVDSGLSSLGPVLGGERPGEGTVTLNGRTIDLAKGNVRDLLKNGVAFIPQDRHAQGLATELTVEENVTLPHLRSRGKGLWTGTQWQRTETEQVIERFDVRPPDRKATIASLSGGNQQKVLLGKWLLGDPVFLVLDDPTQAVDVGARHTILSVSRQAAANGAAVLICSSEVDDLEAICDRVLVMADGVVVTELTRPFTADSIVGATFAAPPRELEEVK